MKEFLKKLGRKATGRRGIGNTMTVVIIIAVVMLNLIAYTVTNAFGLYLYSPEVDDLSISGNTDHLYENARLLGKKVTVTFCYTEDNLEKHDTGKFVLTTARAFAERYPELIELRFVNLLTKLDEDNKIFDFGKYDEINCPYCRAKINYTQVADPDNFFCSGCGRKIGDIKLINDRKNKLRQNSVIFESGEGENWNYRILTDSTTPAGFVDFYTLDSQANIISYNGEEVMASMISWVLSDSHPVAYFTQHHGETADVAFSNMLTCAGYYVETIDLKKNEIPKDAGMIIISNPTSDFQLSSEDSEFRGEINKLRDYLKDGGKLYVALDPYVKELKNLESLLKEWGITLSGKENENGVFVRNIVRENSNAITTDGYTFVATHADNEIASSISSKVGAFGNDSILMREVIKLELDPSLGAIPLLISGKSSSAHAGGEMTDDAGEYPVAACSVRAEKDGKESRVFVIPTAYATASDAFLSNTYSNKDFLYATLEVLFDSNPAPYGCNRVTYRSNILENLTMGRAKLYTAIILAVPTVLAIVGIVTITRRKNR